MSMSDTQAAPEALDPLTLLAIKHGTDKWGPHFYTPVYHSLFAHLREKPVRLLEVGVGGFHLSTVGGESLSMWAEYFPSGRIVGIDLAEKRLDLDPRIRLYQGSEEDVPFLLRVVHECGPFDIIIDDGSHIPQHVVKTFTTLFPAMPDGGLYVIEDIQTTFWTSHGGSTVDGGDTMRLARNILEHINHTEIAVVQPSRSVNPWMKSIRSFRAFHNLFVVEKGDNTEPSSFAYSVDNAHAARAVRTIENQMAKSPTAPGYANLADIYRRADDLERAAAIADDALARWPDNTKLLSIAALIASDHGDLTLKIEYLRRLLAREPDNAAIRSQLQIAQSEAAAAVP